MSFKTLAAAIVLLFCALPPHAAQAPAPSPGAVETVRAYNARPFGSPGWRRIKLELRSRGIVTRTFDILHLWRRQADEIRSLVLLEGPVNLRGTNYLLVENARKPEAGMSLSLFLPSGKRRVLTIKPSRFDEGLLGSDFSYSDLQWMIPIPEANLRAAGTARMSGRTVQVIDGRPADRETSSWVRIRFYIARDPLILLGADYFREGVPEPFKRLRIERFKQVGGVWTPTRMVMSLARNRSSRLDLEEVGFGNARYRDDFFNQENLPGYGDRLLSGQSVVELPPGVRP